MEKDFSTNNLKKRKITYPVYQTTSRFYNLYTDVRTFVRELIQNADDAGATTFQIKIKLPDQIEVINDGKPFDSEDIERLLTPSKGGKRIDQTGDLNLGALSVLTITDQPWYHSGSTLIKFQLDHEIKDFVPYVDENFSEHFKGTRILLPLHSRLSDEDNQKLGLIDDYLDQYPHLLFSKNLMKIEVEYPNRKIIITKKIEKEEILNLNGIKAKIYNISLLKSFHRDENKELSDNKWLIARRETEIPNKFYKDNFFEDNHNHFKFPIYIAFYLENLFPKRVNYPIYIIFPSDTPLGLGFVLSSNFKPDTSRKGFATKSISGKFNRFILGKAAQLLQSLLKYFRENITNKKKSEKLEFFEGLLSSLTYKETFTSLESYIKHYLFDGIKEFLKQNIIDNNGNWCKAFEVVMAEEDLWSFMNNESGLIRPFHDEDVNKLLKNVGVKEYTIKQLVYDVTNGILTDKKRLIGTWDYLLHHQNELNERVISSYLLDRLTDPAEFSENDLNNNDFAGILDRVYSYLGNSMIFKKLPLNLKNRLKEESIIYIPSLKSFKKPSEVVIHSLDTEKIYGSDKHYLKYKEFPNSIPFFKLVGVKTSIKTDNIAEYLIEYIHKGQIETNKLISLYSILGERYNYISDKLKNSLKNAKIIINNDLSGFDLPSEVFIPDEIKYIEQFPSLKISFLDRKIIDFFEKIGVKRVSEAVSKRILISGVIQENEYSKLLSHRLKELVPFIEVILKDTNINSEDYWKKRIYKIKCVVCDQIYHELNFRNKRKKVHARSVEYVQDKNLIAILKNIQTINPGLYLLDLSRALSTIIFIKDIGKAKLISPIIEKLIQSEDKTHLLKELGFSTFTLEMKGQTTQNKNITIPNISNTSKISEFHKDNIVKYYQIESSVQEFLKDHNQKLYKSLEFPGRTTYGGIEQKPQIPKLIFQKKKNFHYYIQENLEFSHSILSLEKFDQMLKFIIECMEGNPETISVAIFEASLHGFNFNGQLYFNYLMLMDDMLKKEIDLYFIWIIVAAHELAHTISRSHDQLHSKYTMILTIRALKNLQKIEQKYKELFKED